jgi:hypothetical protein
MASLAIAQSPATTLYAARPHSNPCSVREPYPTPTAVRGSSKELDDFAGVGVMGAELPRALEQPGMNAVTVLRTGGKQVAQELGQVVSH